MEVQKADPKARRRALYLLALITLVIIGIGLLVGNNPARVRQLKEAITTHVAEMPHLLTVTGVVMMSPILLFAAFVLRYSHRVARTKRFPLSEERLVRDMRVRQGQAAQQVALLLKCLAIALVLCVVAVCVLIYLLAQTLV